MDAGKVYVVFGFGAGDFPLHFDVGADVNPVSGFVIQGDAAGDQAGAQRRLGRRRQQ